MTVLPPIRREVLVESSPGWSFSIFTDDIATWWPVEDFNVHGPGSVGGFEDGKIVERSPDGDEAIWGTVT